MGEMTGEMKNAGSLCLKGLAPSDGRDGPLFVNTPPLSVNNASLISNNPALFALNLILFLRQIFPAWEIFIPTLGTNHSQPGNKTFPPWESCPYIK
jgi:hypothetical protein